MLPIKIEYRYDSGDIEEAYRATRSRVWKKARVRLLLIIVSIVLCFAVFSWLDPLNPALLLLAGIFLGMMAMTLATWLRARRQTLNVWKNYPMIRYKFTAEIDSDC